MQRDQDQDDFTIPEGSYLRLKRALKFVTGLRGQSEGVPSSFTMTIPALDLKPNIFSSSSMRTFTGKIKKGSSKFWAFLTRHDNFLDEARVKAWKTILKSELLTEKLVRNENP